MFELLKKTMLAGLGATVVTKEAIEKQLQELVDKGKISTEEARKAAEKITDESREEYARVRQEAESQFQEFVQRSNLVTRSQWQQLEDRVAALEKKVGDAQAE